MNTQPCGRRTFQDQSLNMAKCDFGRVCHLSTRAHILDVPGSVPLERNGYEEGVVLKVRTWRLAGYQ
jgi:hypothetical protein